MSLTIDDIKTIEIKSLNLNNSQIGADINTRFENINKNFESIINSEYLKGAKGDSIFIKKEKITKDSSIYKEFKDVILSDIKTEINDSRFEHLIGQYVSIIYEKVDTDTKQISILPFIFKDIKFDLHSEDEDMSCIICYQQITDEKTGNTEYKYVKIQDFPVSRK